MGLVGIWCMHFMGNRAIILGDGAADKQLVYNAGYTTLSVFLPILGLVIAFSAAEFSSSAKSRTMHWVSLTCTGVFAGLAIVGMHYVGNFGIANYSLNYAHRFLAASIVIAIGDCLLVLILFYTLREKWISSWWKRVICAVFLAGGVSAMHFTASTGCQYTLRRLNDNAAIRSRNIQVAVAGAFAAAALFFVTGLCIFSRHRKQAMKTRSQKVMLATLMFDPDGRILVTTEGVLPTREITDKYHHRTFNEDFDTSHPVFQWIFRVTRHWNGVSELIPRMKSHLSNAHVMESEHTSRPASSSNSSGIYDPDTYNDYSIIFRERFCVAAASLANAMNLPVERMGVLYDQIIETGTLRAEEKLAKRNTTQFDKLGEAEAGDGAQPTLLFGKGQLLFLTRQLSRDDADKLLNAGFRFGSVQQVGRSIAEPMQITLAALEGHLGNIRRYVGKLTTLDKTGTYLSFFGLVPRPNSKGFDVGVKKDDQDELPDIQLLSTEPSQWQADFMARMDGMKTKNCLFFLEDKYETDMQRTQQERQFGRMLREAIMALSRQVPPDWFREARFLAKPVFAHYTQHYRNRGVVTWIYALCVISDMHTSIEACGNLVKIPLNFFSTKQRCYKGSPDHGILARDIHQEFGPLLARRQPKKSTHSFATSLTRSSRRLATKTPAHSPAEVRRSSSFGEQSGTSSVHELVEKAGRVSERDAVAGSERDNPQRDNIWGGILVNSETVVKSDSKSDWASEPQGIRGGSLGMGMKVAVGTSKQEDTFVDELMEATRLRFVPPKIGY
jgi:NO-binding membrane sensor protein with MHYT domain